MAELSTEARSALIGAGSNKVGAKVLGTGLLPATFVELVEWGLIGPNDGLTVQGSIVRAKIMDAALDAAFG